MCAAAARPAWITKIALNNPGLTRSPLVRIMPIYRESVRAGFTVLVSPLLLGAAVARLIGRAHRAEALLLQAMKAPIFLPAAARMLIPTYLQLGKISEAIKLARLLIVFAPRPEGDRRFSSVWSAYLSVLPNWRPLIAVDRCVSMSTKILVVVGPRPSAEIVEVISQLEATYSTVVASVDMSQPRPLPAVAESFFDGMCTDIAISAQADGFLPDLIVAFPTSAVDHQTTMCALALSRWSDAKSFLATSSLATDEARNEYEKLSLAKSQEIQGQLTNICHVDEIAQLVALHRGDLK